MTASLSYTIPVRTYSEANLREHWRVKAKRAREHRGHAKVATLNAMPYWNRWVPPLLHPIKITMTRIAPRPLDSDNLARSMKAVRDGIADALRIDDGDKRIVWEYDQHKGLPRVCEVRVEIKRMESR